MHPRQWKGKNGVWARRSTRFGGGKKESTVERKEKHTGQKKVYYRSRDYM